jgi:hypothetical protein
MSIGEQASVSSTTGCCAFDVPVAGDPKERLLVVLAVVLGASFEALADGAKSDELLVSR